MTYREQDLIRVESAIDTMRRASVSRPTVFRRELATKPDSARHTDNVGGQHNYDG